MSETKHSPLPWKVCPNQTYYIQSPDCDPGGWIGNMDGSETSEEQDEANAAFVVKAVNAYPRLIEAAYVLVDALSLLKIAEDLLRNHPIGADAHYVITRSEALVAEDEGIRHLLKELGEL